MQGNGHAPPQENGVIDWSAEFATNERWLRTVVFSRVGDAHAAEEVLQNVVLATVEQQPVLRNGDRASAWLYGVAVRQSLMYHRRAGREKELAGCFAAHQRSTGKDGTEYDPLRWILADEERELLRFALGALRTGDRELLLLKYTENWTSRELAGRLGIQITTVETRLQRARQRLREELARLNYHGGGS